MSTVKAFDLLNAPLEGTTLIEASAGTGKTYAITGLFLRLLLEKELPVDQILVVTFTEAATGELKERIRTTLREALKAVANGRSENSFLSDVIARQKSAPVSLRRLREALRAFDQAGIIMPEPTYQIKIGNDSGIDLTQNNRTGQEDTHLIDTQPQMLAHATIDISTDNTIDKKVVKEQEPSDTLNLLNKNASQE